MRTCSYIAALSVLVAVGCGDNVMRTVCTGGPTGPVVAGAALFELDDYGTLAHCRGADIDDASVAPVTRRTFLAGSAISLQIAPGQHTLVLRAFSDAGGTDLLGSGCVEENLAPGAEVCIDMVLTARDPQCMLGTVDDCGACGAPCDRVRSDGAACNAGACSYTGCKAGFADCNGGAPNRDGCECEGSACCNTSCQTKHSDGLGDSFYDCVALGTYDATQAGKAAAAWDANGSIGNAMNYSDNFGVVSYRCNHSTAKSMCACWTWGGSGNYAGPGRAIAFGPKSTSCNIPLGNMYPTWN
jgi:hypothetical protein